MSAATSTGRSSPDRTVPLNEHLWSAVLRQYSAEVRERTGREPARLTRQVKANKLSKACALLGVAKGDAYGLASALADPGGLVNLIDKWRAEGVTNGTLRVALDTLKTFAAFCITEGLPVPDLTMRRPPPNPRQAGDLKVFTAAEVDDLVRTAGEFGPHYESALAFLAYTGRRSGELLNLRWADLNLAATPPSALLRATKNHQDHAIGLPRKVVAHFTPARVALLKSGLTVRESVNDPGEYVIPYRYSALRDAWLAQLARHGLKYRGLHSLRHTAATRMLQAGVPIAHVASLLGNSQATVAAYYSHLQATSFTEYLEAL